MRRSIWEAMFSATSWASSSGCLISWMEMRTRLPKRFSRSSQLVDARAALADDDAGLGGVDRDRELGVGAALSLDLGDAGVAEARQDDAAHLEVLVQHVGVVLGVGEPVRLPGTEDTKTKCVGVDFMTQLALCSLRLVLDDRRDVA